MGTYADMRDAAALGIDPQTWAEDVDRIISALDEMDEYPKFSSEVVGNTEVANGFLLGLLVARDIATLEGTDADDLVLRITGVDYASLVATALYALTTESSPGPTTGLYL